jgi:GH24 family phage-related lysozyme (muramidase)
MSWTLSSNGFNFLKQREGVIHKPVWDRTNYAVGIGHNGPDVDPNHYYTDKEIERLFQKDKVKIEAAANKFPNIQNQSQYDALFSLCYNCGGGIASAGNRIYDAMHNNEHSNNRASFTKKWSNYRWNNGQLRSRRAAEINLFYSQPANPASTDAS